MSAHRAPRRLPRMPIFAAVVALVGVAALGLTGGTTFADIAPR